MNDPLRALLLGAVQGLTEFLPISSSAHLVLVPWLLGWEESGLAFDVALHMGTLLAIVIYFWRDLWNTLYCGMRGLLLRRPEDEQHLRLAILLLVGSVPAAVIGLLFEDIIDLTFHSGGRSALSLLIIAAGLAGVALALLWAERTGSHSRPVASLGVVQALFIGLAQAFALIPGVSRSGSTITAGLLVGLKRDAAARFSFLLAVPITIGAGLLQALELVRLGLAPDERLSFLVGMVSAAVVGYISIGFLLHFLQRHSTLPFIVYRVGLALLVLALVVVGYGIG